jgi:CDP-diacylglycerol--glycerol-3-phosphate 3-phosphatidyltransferase
MNLIPQRVKDGFVRAIAPIARALIRAGISPNAITTAGAFVILGSAAAFARGEIHLGGFLLLFSGVFDLLDGQVARQGRRATDFGAFYDSTLDRVGESALFGGIALYFLRGGVPPARVTLAVGLAIAALAASLLVSYTRARAEGLGYQCKVGIAARAERLLLLGLPTLLFGPGRDGWLLFAITALLALATAVTVVQRVVHIARIAAAAAQRETLPGRPTAVRKGT